jgi:transcriptional regulator of acetoin/glycerol metabolism
LKLARSCVAGVEVDEDVVSEVGSYAWPGGLGEMENVARAALEVERSRISKRSLMQTGWDARRSAADDGLTESERAILGVVRDAASAVGVTQIAAETDRPVRTVLRHLTGLVRDGRVLRSGRGRATRYRLPRRDGSARA